MLSVRDKGLVVLTGCGHADVVNTARFPDAFIQTSVGTSFEL